MNTSPNPNAHTAGETISAVLTAEEAERLERHIRPLADAGRGVKRSAFAYLVAVKADQPARLPTDNSSVPLEGYSYSHPIS